MADSFSLALLDHGYKMLIRPCCFVCHVNKKYPNYKYFMVSISSLYNLNNCLSLSFEKFNFGVAHRGASIRIPRQVAADGKGYFEVI